jgi:5-deoxy-glucuronate isomerase
MSLHLRAAEVSEQGISPARAGWDFAGLRLLSLRSGQVEGLSLGGEEAALVPLAGSFEISTRQGSLTLAGREGVFEGPTDIIYLPPGTDGSVASVAAGVLAVCTARADSGGPVFHRPASEVAVEVRGRGAATRQINQLLPAEITGPERLMVVEVITPDGNWSSYPPHKHDETGDAECPLEEIYYFRFDRPGGFGFHRTYTSDGTIDETVTVADGDAFLVPRGYHGPCAAAPGYPMYYLNVMAGPGPRAWLVTTDPDHAWLWDSWADQDRDRRVPWKESSQ